MTATKCASSNTMATGRQARNRRRGLGAGASSLGLLLVVPLAGATGMARDHKGKQPAPGPAITVRVYPYARLSSADLTAAENVASRIFKWTGVELTWVDCPARSQQARQNPACQNSNTPTELSLRLIADFPELPEPIMGYSVPIPPPQHGYLVGIALERARERLREAPELTLGELLGHVIAHEIGHLLLGTENHSSSGLMQAYWDPRQLQLALGGLLNFSARQAEAIRADVQARWRDQASQGRREVAQAPPSTVP